MCARANRFNPAGQQYWVEAPDAAEPAVSIQNYGQKTGYSRSLSQIKSKIGLPLSQPWRLRCTEDFGCSSAAQAEHLDEVGNVVSTETCPRLCTGLTEYYQA